MNLKDFHITIIIPCFNEKDNERKNNLGTVHSAIKTRHPYTHAGMNPHARRIVRVPPKAQTMAIAMLAIPRCPLGRYSRQIVIH